MVGRLQLAMRACGSCDRTAGASRRELDDLGYRGYGARGAVLPMQVPLAEAMALLDLALSRG